MSTNLDAIAENLRSEAASMHSAREAGLQKSRALIQLCAKAIRHIHRRQFDEARTLIEQAKRTAEETRTTLSPNPSLYHAGYLQDAEKELVEAAVVWAIVKSEPYPTPDELGVAVFTYLNGLGEAASEVRRYALDEMREGRLAETERILAQMEDIYDELVTFDYSDGMTGGLRRTTDALRAVVERTRSDLSLTTMQQRLVDQLRLHGQD